ncbi:MAG: PorT family protein [Bacteroidaceae bacterium]|nr:PorT family protein [Bacteroidaceae bacterium]
MKKIACMAAIAAALLFATPAQAQFCWGIKGGVNVGNNDLTVLKDKEAAFNMDNYSGFFIGPKAELRIPILGLGVEAAALYSQKGMKLAEGETFKQNSFQIPLSAKYAFGLGNIANVFIAAGPEFGFNVGETQKLVNGLTFNNENKPESGSVQGYIAEKSTLSINAGIGVTLLNHLQVAINYNMPWGKTGEFVYIDSSEIENAEDIQNGQITFDALEKLSNTADKAKTAINNIKAGTVQLSVAYLF